MILKKIPSLIGESAQQILEMTEQVGHSYLIYRIAALGSIFGFGRFLLKSRWNVTFVG